MITKDLFGRILPRIVYSRVHSGEKKKRHDIKYFEALYLWQFSYDGEVFHDVNRFERKKKLIFEGVR